MPLLLTQLCVQRWSPPAPSGPTLKAAAQYCTLLLLVLGSAGVVHGCKSPFNVTFDQMLELHRQPSLSSATLETVLLPVGRCFSLFNAENGAAGGPIIRTRSLEIKGTSDMGGERSIIDLGFTTGISWLAPGDGCELNLITVPDCLYCCPCCACSPCHIHKPT